MIYVASVGEQVVVLHACQKKTQGTSQHDIDLATSRPRASKGWAMEAQEFDDVFDALSDTPAEAANLKARGVAQRLGPTRQILGMSQGAAAARLGVTRPRLNDLMRGKLGKFSLDALVDLCHSGGPQANGLTRFRVTRAKFRALL